MVDVSDGGRDDARNMNIDSVNGLVSEPVKIAELLNDQFVENGVILSRALPIQQLDPLIFLRHRVGTEFQMIPITVQETIDTVTSLRSTSPGYDDIPGDIIKKVVHTISSPITHIFNSSLRSGIFPSQLKLTKVTPIFKKGNKNQAINYRPISIISFFSKVLEKLVYNRLNCFLNS